MSKSLATAVMLLTTPALIGCGETMQAYEGTPRAGAEVATIVGGTLPNVTALNGVPVAAAPFGQPTIAVLPGSHRLEIRYQPCTRYNNCGLVRIAAEVALAGGRTYEPRQRTKGCSLFESLAWVWPGAGVEACRTYIWIEDKADGRAVWGAKPPS